MKLIIAIIQPHKLEAVKKELEAVDVNLMTVTNVLGQGRQKGLTEIYRGAKEAGGLLNKVRLDIAVNEDLRPFRPSLKAPTPERPATGRSLSWTCRSASGSAPGSGDPQPSVKKFMDAADFSSLASDYIRGPRIRRSLRRFGAICVLEGRLHFYIIPYFFSFW